MWSSGSSSDWVDPSSAAAAAAVHQDRQGSSSSRSTSSSRSHYSVDPESCPWRQNEETVETTYGPLHVTVCGDTSYPPLVTYHDIGLNHSTCFQSLLLCQEMSSLLLQNFCVFHIDAPGHEPDAEEIDVDEPCMSTDDLAEQVAQVLAHFGLTEVTCLGVSAGAYVLTLLAVRRPDLVKGLVLVSPLCRAPSWSEWAHNKVLMSILSYYGITRFVKDSLLDRFFCREQSGYHGPGSDSLIAFREELDERDPENVMRYLRSVQQRKDLTPLLRHVKAEVLVVVGALSPFREESGHMLQHLDPQRTTFAEIEACGSLVTVERPHTMYKPMRTFFSRVIPSLAHYSYPRSSFTSDAFYYSSSSSGEPSPAARSPSICRSSVPASPMSAHSGSLSPLSTFFADARRVSMFRAGAYIGAASAEDLSLTAEQKRLRPIRTRICYHEEW